MQSPKLNRLLTVLIQFNVVSVGAALTENALQMHTSTKHQTIQGWVGIITAFFSLICLAGIIVTSRLTISSRLCRVRHNISRGFEMRRPIPLFSAGATTAVFHVVSSSVQSVIIYSSRRCRLNIFLYIKHVNV